MDEINVSLPLNLEENRMCKKALRFLVARSDEGGLCLVDMNEIGRDCAATLPVVSQALTSLELAGLIVNIEGQLWQVLPERRG